MKTVNASTSTVMLNLIDLNRVCRKLYKRTKNFSVKLISKALLAYEDGDRIHQRIQAQQQEIRMRYMRDLFPPY